MLIYTNINNNKSNKISERKFPILSVIQTETANEDLKFYNYIVSKG